MSIWDWHIDVGSCYNGSNGPNIRSRWKRMDIDVIIMETGDCIFDRTARSSVERGEQWMDGSQRSSPYRPIVLSSYRPTDYLANAPFAICQLALLPRREASRSLVSLLIKPYLHRPARWRRFIPPASPVSSLLGRLVRLGRPSTRSRRFDANLRVTMAP